MASLTAPADQKRKELHDPAFRAGPPWPPSVIEAAKRLILWTVERYQQEEKREDRQG